MSKVVLITGASSGFGALTARALADTGHCVYAGIRHMTCRNRDACRDHPLRRGPQGRSAQRRETEPSVPG